MKQIILLLLLCSLVACKNDDGGDSEPLSEGLITGLDMTLCACCGGYFIEIDGELHRFYLESLPPNDLDIPNSTLPLAVKLDWAPFDPNETCADDLIKIISIEEN